MPFPEDQHYSKMYVIAVCYFLTNNLLPGCHGYISICLTLYRLTIDNK